MPRDPLTAEAFESGPIILSENQKRILDAALGRDEKGLLRYSTVIYSCPKKSGKSTISSAVALYLAEHTDFGRIYCLANDGKQSADRLYGPIYNNFQLHSKIGGIYSNIRKNLTEVTLPNNAKIEAIPCDASGEAGAEPTGVFYSELWGYDTEAKRRLFTELTIPPTLYGYAIRWIESYAGYEGVSDLLWELYVTGRKSDDAVPHPDFLDLIDEEGNPVVWVNEKAGMFCYWDTVPRMAWQTEEYYSQEQQILSREEFLRVHRNQWVSPVGSFIRPEWWDSCRDYKLLPISPGSKVPLVMAIDAAVYQDCAACVLVGRDPTFPTTDVAIYGCRVFTPPPNGGGIDLEETIGKTIREWSKKYNIVCVVYDQYQMENLVKNYRNGLVNIHVRDTYDMTEEERKEFMKSESRAVQLWYKMFGQQNLRTLSDKRLRDMIQQRQIHWNVFDGEAVFSEDNRETLSKHVKQAGSSISGEKLRITKFTKDAKIDAAVALSMAVYQCMSLDLSAERNDAETLIRRLANGEITYDQFKTFVDSQRVNIRDE